jgi:hypothetical protein
MARKKFDCFMLHVNAGTNEKLATLSDSEYRAHVSGILAIAATAPVRGRLLVGEMEAEPVQIARKAGVTPQAAASALEKLKKVGVLERDEELDCWVVHDWGELNPEPKKDATAAERQRRYRERRTAQRNAPVTPGVTPLSRRNARDDHAPSNAPVTPPEVEGEGEEETAVALQPVKDHDFGPRVRTNGAGERGRVEPDPALSGGTA